MVPKSTTEADGRVLGRTRAERPPLREEMRPARGLLVGLALSTIFWLALLVRWLAG